MKKTLTLFFAFSSFIACNWSNHPKYKRIKLDNSLCWQISGNGLTYPSYLFGTDHRVGGNFLDTLPYVMERFKLCKSVACEVDFESDSDEYKSHIFLKNDSLSNLFTPVEFSEVDTALTRLKLPPLKKFNRLKPIYVYDDLYYFISQHTASRTNHHLDRYFRETGRKLGLKIIGLEGVRFHDSLLYDQPLKAQKAQLLYFVRNITRYQISAQKDFKLYHNQNLNGLEISINPKETFTSARMDQVIRNRNMNWLRKLPGIIKEQPTFIAVGAGHLLWDCGLINQLRLKGYKVKPVLN